jgi:hypothetical protein
MGILKIEEKVEQHFEPKEINFQSYLAFIQSELLNNLQQSPTKDNNFNLAKVDEVCWFVCCKDYVQRNGALLSMDNMFVLWKMFNVVVDRDYDENLPIIPVVADCEEICIIAQKFCNILGQTFDVSDFKTLSTELPKFCFAQVLNLWENRLCKDIGQKLIPNALKELEDEIVQEVIKKVTIKYFIIYLIKQDTPTIFHKQFMVRKSHDLRLTYCCVIDLVK